MTPTASAVSTRNAWVRQRKTNSVNRVTPAIAKPEVRQVSLPIVVSSSTAIAGCPVNATR